MLIGSLAASQVLVAVAQSATSRDPLSRSHDDRQLTVMTWNLEWFYDDQSGDNASELAKKKSAPSRNDWNWRRDAVAQSIAQVQPSIVAVQEVESRRVLWYLRSALARNHKLTYHELGIESRDHYTEQDVGLLYRSPVDALSISQKMYPLRLRETKEYFDLSKHLFAVFEFRSGHTRERVTVVNVHLRATAEAEDKRRRQARLLHHWIAESVRAGEQVIVLGDWNTEFQGVSPDPTSDLGIVCGLETPTVDDDLVDLHLSLPPLVRATHSSGKQFDRILCSRSLVEDDPERPNLVFQKIEVLPDLAVRGDRDDPQEHWERYWKIPAIQRDLSDHYPVMATFEMR